MNEEYIIIKGCRKRRYNDWADRFVYVYSKFDGKRITFPLGDKLLSTEVDGDSALKIAYSLKETHPYIYEHAMEMARSMSCDIERTKED